MSVQPGQAHRALCSEGPCTGGLMLRELLMNVTCESVFSKWSQMGQWNTHWVLEYHFTPDPTSHSVPMFLATLLVVAHSLASGTLSSTGLRAPPSHPETPAASSWDSDPVEWAGGGGGTLSLSSVPVGAWARPQGGSGSGPLHASWQGGDKVAAFLSPGQSRGWDVRQETQISWTPPSQASVPQFGSEGSPLRFTICSGLRAWEQRLACPLS